MRQIFVEHVKDIGETCDIYTIYMRQIFVEHVTLVELATDSCGTCDISGTSVRYLWNM